MVISKTIGYTNKAIYRNSSRNRVVQNLNLEFLAYVQRRNAGSVADGLSQRMCNPQRLTARLLCLFVVCIKTLNCGTQIIPHRLADYP